MDLLILDSCIKPTHLQPTMKFLDKFGWLKGLFSYRFETILGSRRAASQTHDAFGRLQTATGRIDFHRLCL
jgi:hypothetical protein